ncbi:MAG: nucleotide pyrophosphohydrolase, partial [Alphaproteobacteria bacterium]|nr:nucleotide pyrophosphohydrolase [Alphaproteobacteria bacterium]
MNKKDLSFSTMLKLQDDMYEKHDWWDCRTPENGIKKLLWVFEELGEVISLIKKKGTKEILNTPETRE